MIGLGSDKNAIHVYASIHRTFCDANIEAMKKKTNCAMILQQYGKDAQPVCPLPPRHLPSQPVRGEA